MKISDFDKRLMKNIIKKPEKVAWSRLGKQKKINLFGDKDKDKLMNIFDCDPLNTKKQATYHKVLNLLGGKGYKEDIDTVKLEGAQTRDLKTGQYVIRPNQPISNTEWVKESSVGKGIGDVWESTKKGTGNIWQATGIPQKMQENTEDAEWRKQIRKQAYEEAIKEGTVLKTQQQFQAEKEKYLRSLGLGNKQEPTFRQEAGKQLRGMEAGLIQATGQLQRGISAANPTTWGYRVDDLIGMRGSRGAYQAVAPRGDEGIYKALGVAPPIMVQQPVPMQAPQVQPQQSQQQYGPPTQQPIQVQQVPVERGVISPYSKRRVSYTRGPYKKRIQYQQPTY